MDKSKLSQLKSLRNIEYILTGNSALTCYIHKNEIHKIDNILAKSGKLEIITSKNISLPNTITVSIVSPILFTHLSQNSQIIGNHRVCSPRWLKTYFLRKYKTPTKETYQRLLEISELLKPHKKKESYPEKNYVLSRNTNTVIDKYIKKHNIIVCGKKAQELTSFYLKDSPAIPFFILLSDKPNLLSRLISSELKQCNSRLLDCSSNSPKIYEIYQKNGNTVAYIIEQKEKITSGDFIEINGYTVASIPIMTYILERCSMYMPLSINRNTLEEYVDYLMMRFIAISEI